MRRAEKHQGALVLRVLGDQLSELLDLAGDVTVRAGGGGENHPTLSFRDLARERFRLAELGEELVGARLGGRQAEPGESEVGVGGDRLLEKGARLLDSQAFGEVPALEIVGSRRLRLGSDRDLAVGRGWRGRKGQGGECDQAEGADHGGGGERAASMHRSLL